MLLTQPKDYHRAANQGCLLAAIYAYGDLPPNHPVPAISHASYEPNFFGHKAWVIVKHWHLGVELVDILCCDALYDDDEWEWIP